MYRKKCLQHCKTLVYEVLLPGLYTSIDFWMELLRICGSVLKQSNKVYRKLEVTVIQNLKGRRYEIKMAE